MKQKADRQLATDALKWLWDSGLLSPDLVHHSDRGSQYTSKEYRQLLEDHHIQVSMSAAGKCYDNAMMESFFATLKTEYSHRRIATVQEARQAVFDFMRFGITGKDGILPWDSSARSNMNSLPIRQNHCPPKRGNFTTVKAVGRPDGLC